MNEPTHKNCPDGEYEVDMATMSTFEWLGVSLVEYVLEEERREEGLEELNCTRSE